MRKVFRVSASFDEGKVAEKKAREALDKFKLHHECYWSPSRKQLIVDVNGDWKHDHLAVEKVLKEAGFSPAGMQQYGESDGDWYHAERYFKLESDVGDDKLRSYAGKDYKKVLDLLEGEGFDVDWARTRPVSDEHPVDLGFYRGDGKVLFIRVDGKTGKVEGAYWANGKGWASIASSSMVRAYVEPRSLEGLPYEQALKRLSEDGWSVGGYMPDGRYGFVQHFSKANGAWYAVSVKKGVVQSVTAEKEDKAEASSREATAKVQKDWTNVYVVRQEYNQYQKAWFPILFYWNRSEDKPEGWVEFLATESGHDFYYDEAKVWYDSISKPGTSKCDPEHVKAIVDKFKADNEGPVYEVSKLTVYSPSRKAHACSDRSITAARKVDCKRAAIKEWMSDLGKPGVDCGTLYQYMNETDFISMDELLNQQNDYWRKKLDAIIAEYPDKCEAAGRICDKMDGYTLAVVDGPDGSPWFLVWK